MVKMSPSSLLELYEYGKSTIRSAARFSPTKWPCVCVPRGYKLRRSAFRPSTHSLSTLLGFERALTSLNPPIYLTATATMMAHNTAAWLKRGGWSRTAHRYLAARVLHSHRHRALCPCQCLTDWVRSISPVCASGGEASLTSPLMFSYTDTHRCAHTQGWFV